MNVIENNKIENFKNHKVVKEFKNLTTGSKIPQSINTFFQAVVVGTSYDIVTGLANSYKAARFLNSYLPDHTGYAWDTWGSCCHSTRIRSSRRMNFLCIPFAGSCQSCSSCTQFRYRKLHSHSSGIDVGRKFSFDPASWSNSKELTDCHCLPDAVDRFYYTQSRNLILPNPRLLGMARLWLCISGLPH